MGELMVRLILIFFYFSLFKYLFLILGSPLFAYLSEKTEAIMEGKDFPFSFQQMLNDVYRGIRLALQKYIMAIGIYDLHINCFFFPVVGWITPLVMLFIECYYYGFSMLDYSCERRKLSASESIEFIAET